MVFFVLSVQARFSCLHATSQFFFTVEAFFDRPPSRHPPQIIQHRSTEYTYGRTTTAFSFPLLVSYLPLSTTIGEFRDMLAVVLRRFVLPRDAARKVRTDTKYGCPINALWHEPTSAPFSNGTSHPPLPARVPFLLDIKVTSRHGREFFVVVP